MNKKEAEDIAWQLLKIEEATEVRGIDSATVIANVALDVVYSILKHHPKIKRAYDEWEQVIT